MEATDYPDEAGLTETPLRTPFGWVGRWGLGEFISCTHNAIHMSYSIYINQDFIEVSKHDRTPFKQAADTVWNMLETLVWFSPSISPSLACQPLICYTVLWKHEDILTSHILHAFSSLRWPKYLKSLHMKYRDTFILHNETHYTYISGALGPQNIPVA